MESLKAQGFHESNSKSKLVYKFDQKKDDNDEKEAQSRSPVRQSKFVKEDEGAKERRRSLSPVRSNPFLLKDKQSVRSPVRQERGRSPTKKTGHFYHEYYLKYKFNRMDSKHYPN